LAQIDRLRIHIKENILYYMQAIWDHEPPDQRYFRLYNVDVPMITAQTVGAAVDVYVSTNPLTSGTFTVQLPMPPVSFPTQKLYQVADLDNLLGYKGNYMIFALTKNNYLTLHMMQDYLDIGNEVTVRDPDEFGNYTMAQLKELARCLYNSDPKAFKNVEGQIKQKIIDRLTSSRTESDIVIVPTKSLYMEALVGTHPLLEDFKLIHRALDVKKVQAEVRHAELENVRLAARVLHDDYEDPDIEKKIVIENGTELVVDTE
jgi:hypothetical protein